MPDRRPDPLAARELALDLDAALATLPAEQRAALVLVDMYGYPVDEAADDPRLRRGHREEPLRARAGTACPAPAARPDRPVSIRSATSDQVRVAGNPFDVARVPP